MTKRSLKKKKKEKRVLYVALTRAKREVSMYYASSNAPEKTVSSFIKDFNTRDYEAKGFKKTQIE